ncbi:MAG: hypothetical protein SGILL_006450, partial [Bacillariaceae sp.]
PQANQDAGPQPQANGANQDGDGSGRRGRGRTSVREPVGEPVAKRTRSAERLAREQREALLEAKALAAKEAEDAAFAEDEEAEETTFAETAHAAREAEDAHAVQEAEAARAAQQAEAARVAHAAKAARAARFWGRLEKPCLIVLASAIIIEFLILFVFAGIEFGWSWGSFSDNPMALQDAVRRELRTLFPTIWHYLFTVIAICTTIWNFMKSFWDDQATQGGNGTTEL